MNQVSSRSHYGSKVPAVPITVFKIQTRSLTELFSRLFYFLNYNIIIVQDWNKRSCPCCVAPRSSPKYSCGKTKPLYPIRVASCVSKILYLIHICELSKSYQMYMYSPRYRDNHVELFYFTFTDNVRLLDIYKTIARNYEIIGHSK